MATATIQFEADTAMSYWPTPDTVGAELLDLTLEPWHADGEGIRVLEPSAGEGHLVRVIQQRLPEARITAVEPSPSRAAALRRLPGSVDVIEATFEGYLVDVNRQAFTGQWQPFDLVLMNPPFTLPGRSEVWADHVLAAYHDPHLLSGGGLISAVVPHILCTGKSRRVRDVRKLTDSCGRLYPCERGAFDPVGAGVATALMWTQRPFEAPIPAP